MSRVIKNHTNNLLVIPYFGFTLGPFLIMPEHGKGQGPRLRKPTTHFLKKTMLSRKNGLSFEAISEPPFGLRSLFCCFGARRSLLKIFYEFLQLNALSSLDRKSDGTERLPCEFFFSNRFQTIRWRDFNGFDRNSGKNVSILCNCFFHIR